MTSRVSASIPKLALIAGLITGLCACSDSEGDTSGGGGTTEQCADYADISGSVSFETDVMPVFVGACSLSASCHQAPNGKEDLSLGNDPAMMVTAGEVHAAIVGVPSALATRDLVVAGDPAGSWLMNVMEYSTADTLQQCTGESCGDDCPTQMPQGGGRLAQDRLDAIATWIKDGAPNN